MAKCGPNHAVKYIPTHHDRPLLIAAITELMESKLSWAAISTQLAIRGFRRKCECEIGAESIHNWVGNNMDRAAAVTKKTPSDIDELADLILAANIPVDLRRKLLQVLWK